MLQNQPYHKKEKMKIQYILLTLLSILSSCMKEKGEQLPKKTAVGAYTFGCMIDNDVFVATGRCDYSVGFNFQTNCVTSEIDIPRERQSPFRSLAYRLSACRWRSHGAVQLAVRPQTWRRFPVAHRRHR